MSTSQPSEVAIEGSLFSGRNSHRQGATLRSVDELAVIEWPGGKLRLEPDDIDISPRIGNTPRYLYLPDDQVFETTDNDGVDRLSKQIGAGASRWIHRLENHLGLILLASVFTLATVAFVFVYGVPWTSQAIANALPDELVEHVGDSSLETLDKLWFEPTNLPPERQKTLQSRFAPFLTPVDGQDLEVVFRSSDAIGANAMALPNGTLIFTDDLVNLAEDDNELVAILAHEIGHVAHRHGMKGVVQSSLTTWLIVLMTGDLSAFSDTTVALPAILMSLAYSRDLEREADGYALETLKANQIPARHFANIMERLMATHGEPESDEDNDSDGWHQIGDLLSSHPGTAERIERFRQQP
ncbi:M48 family metallopeptidase [Marinobacter sp. CHS3-4]|uniref:M48 family metallopeptidase n=1 Tax=Marinobacter sp. CHS3-4 TaxID=3045174 RepID=UPI0024B48BBE|nr:M48 family metallopeptidase [Marinobacter sp. CHS3-4]MDI9244286.1 M48 family metallopeptidase [Marinobacter sp. CHS3-4]